MSGPRLRWGTGCCTSSRGYKESVGIPSDLAALSIVEDVFAFVPQPPHRHCRRNRIHPSHHSLKPIKVQECKAIQTEWWYFITTDGMK